MKKNRVIKIFIALFWGINFLPLILYSIIFWIISKINPKNEEVDTLSDLEENSKLFRIIIGIPAISIIILILFKGNSLIYIGYFYSMLLMISSILILFTKKSIYAFNEKKSKVLSDFKEFGIMLFVDLIIFFSITVYFLLNTSLLIGFIIFSITTGSIIFALSKFYSLYKKEGKTLKELKKSHNLIEFSSNNSEDLIEIIKKIEKKIYSQIKNEDSENEITIFLLENILIKYKKLFKLLRKENSKHLMIKIKPKYQKNKKILYNIKFKAYNKNYRVIIKQSKTHKANQQLKKMLKSYNKAYSMTKNHLILAKKYGNKKERKKIIERLDYLKLKIRNNINE